MIGAHGALCGCNEATTCLWVRCLLPFLLQAYSGTHGRPMSAFACRRLPSAKERSSIPELLELIWLVTIVDVCDV